MTRQLEERLGEIARRQHGVVSRPQLLAIGLSPRAIQGRVQSGRRGVASLRAMLHLSRGPAFTRSDLEDRFRDAVRRFQLPDPRFNARAHGYEIDCFWPDASLAVELDGAAHHGSWQSQQNDRRRDSDLATRGIHVIRITWDQLVRETEPTMARVAQAIAVGRERLHGPRPR
jgi:very-short-patch-repair endonuclease